MARKLSTALALLACASLPAFAQSRGLMVAGPDKQVITSFSASQALVIGESEYVNGWPKLPGVRTDVVAVKRLFEEMGFSVRTIQDAGAQGLVSGIEQFFNDFGYDKDTRLLVYYAGHGATLKLDGVRDMGYIVPVDAPDFHKDEKGFKQKAVPMQRFDTWAKQIESRHVLFLFDSCFSGSVFATSRALPGVIDYKISNPVRQFITSGAADETVPDRSVFRAQLEAALRNGDADANRDGYVSGSELGDFLQSAVVNYSYNSQHPQYGKIRDPSLDKGDFVFAVRAAPPAAAPSAQAKAGTAPAGAGESWGEVVVVPGRLTVSVATAGTITFNGKSKQLPAGANVSIDNVAPGDYGVGASYADGQSETRKVRIEPGANASVAFSYKPPAAGRVAAATPAAPASPAAVPGRKLDGARLAVAAGHNESLVALAISPDGKLLLSASGAKISLWDVLAGKELRTHPLDISFYDTCTFCLFSPPGDRYLIADSKGFHLFSTASGAEIAGSFKKGQRIVSAAFSPDGRFLAICPKGDDPLTLYDAASCAVVGTIRGTGDAPRMAFSRDGSRLLTLRTNGERLFQTWDTATFKRVDSRSFPGTSFGWLWERTIALSDGGSALAYDSGRKISLWRPGKDAPDWTSVELAGQVQFIVPANDGSAFYVCADEQLFRLNAANGAVDWQASAPSRLQPGALTPQGDSLVAGDIWGRILFFSTATGKKERSIETYARQINGIAFTPDGSGLLVDTKYYNGVLWSTGRGIPLKPRQWLGGSNYTASSDISPKGDTYLQMGNDKKLQLRSLADGSVIRSHDPAGDWRFSPDAAYYFTATTGEKSLLQAWRTDSGQLLWQKEIRYLRHFWAHPRRNTLVVIQIDESTVYVNMDKVCEYDLLTGALVRTDIKQIFQSKMALSPDGRYGAVEVNARVEMLDLEAGKSLWLLDAGKANPMAESNRSIAFAADGKSFFVGDGAGAITRYDAASGAQLMVFRADCGTCRYLAPSPDGRLLASGGDDGIVRLWDLRNGKELCSFFSVNSSEWIAWNPEGFFAGSDWAKRYLTYLVKDSAIVDIAPYLDAYCRPEFFNLAP